LFLGNDTIQFAGAAIGNDIQELKFYKLAIKNAVDLQQLGIKVHNLKEGQLVSLENLAKKVAKIKLNKDKHVSVSLWESSDLNLEQIKYACLDAYASFEVFRKHSNIYLKSD
jgi:ribonuclease D